MIRPIFPWWPITPSEPKDPIIVPPIIKDPFYRDPGISSPSDNSFGTEGESTGGSDDSAASDFNSVINGGSLTDNDGSASGDDSSYDSFRDIENYLDDIVSAIEKQYQFNADEARKSREWSEMMSNTSFQRAVADMKKAGINPLLAINQLGGASVPSSSQASASSNSASALSSLYGSLTSQRGQSLTTSVNLFRLIFQLLFNFIS